MAIRNPMTVQKMTVAAVSVKLTTPADRIGLGSMAEALHPANIPSVYPTSERLSGSRSRLAASAASSAEPHAVRVGVFTAPGSSARPHDALRGLTQTGWPTATKRDCESGLPGCKRSRIRLPGDCQSPDRFDHPTHPATKHPCLVRDVRTVTTAKK